MSIDPTTNIGKLRLRVADYSDLPFLPDSVYQSTLDDTNNNLPKSAKIIGMYILGMLAHKTHKKFNQLETWGQEAFESYQKFLIMTVSNPNFVDLSPVPYSVYSEGSPILQFQKDWNKNFYNRTEAQQLAVNADASPNDGSRTGLNLYVY